MTIRFLGLGEARAAYGPTILAWNAQVIPAAEGFAELQRVRRWAMRSPTAQRILRTVEEARVRANVVCFNGSGQTVFGPDDQGMGSVFWDIGARFTTRGGTAPFHQYVAFLHELGHFIQWHTNPSFYAGNMLHNSRGIADAAKAFFLRAAERGGAASYGQKNAYATARMQPSPAAQGKAWSVRVEMDNLARHEWPMCDEARLPRRLEYTDLQVSDGSLLRV